MIPLMCAAERVPVTSKEAYAFKGDILGKQHFSWDLGCYFGSLVLPHAYKLWNKSVRDFLSEICISESTSTSPSPSNQTIATILWTSGRALGGDVRAFQKQGDSIQKKIHRSVCHVTASLAGSPSELPYSRRRENNPFLLHVMDQSGHQRVNVTAPFPQLIISSGGAHFCSWYHILYYIDTFILYYIK